MKRETGGRLFILPYGANIPVKFPLMVARVIVQPPVRSTVFLLVRKAAFKTAFYLELRYYMTSFPLAVLRLEVGFGEPANTLPRGYCARLPRRHDCSRRRYQCQHTTELPPKICDQPLFCLSFFTWPGGGLALLYTAGVVVCIQLAWLNAQWPIYVLSVFWNIIQKYLLMLSCILPVQPNNFLLILILGLIHVKVQCQVRFSWYF